MKPGDRQNVNAQATLANSSTARQWWRRGNLSGNAPPVTGFSSQTTSTLVVDGGCLSPLARGAVSRDQVRCHNADELSRCDHLGFLPELRKMPLVASYEVVRARSIGAFEELVIGRVVRHLEPAARDDGIRTASDELQELLSQPPANMKLRTRKHLVVLRKNGGRNIQPGRLGDR